MFWTVVLTAWIAPQILVVVFGMIAANRKHKLEEESAPVRMLASHPALKAIRSMTPILVRKISASIAPKKAVEKIDTSYSFVAIDR